MNQSARSAGQNVNQFGADWYVVNAAGNKIDTDENQPFTPLT